MEVQRSYFTVVQSKVASLEDYDKLPEEKKLAFLQVASLFESLGFLVEKGFVKAEIVDDMFATKTAWEMTKPFILGMRRGQPRTITSSSRNSSTGSPRRRPAR